MWDVCVYTMEYYLAIKRASLVAQTVRICLQCRRHRSDLWLAKIPWKKEWLPIAWRIPWTEEPDRLQSMGSQIVGQDWATNTFTVIKKNGILQSATNWIDLKAIILSKIIQRKTNITWSHLICGIWKHNQQNKTDLQIQRRRGVGEMGQRDHVVKTFRYK